MIDVLIAGGGPAGLATAMWAAQVGLRALVVEPRISPIDKACGEGIMPSGVRALRALGIELQGAAIRGIRYRNTHTCVDSIFREHHGLGVRRTDLHAALHNRANQLGVTTEKSTVVSVQQKHDSVHAELTSGSVDARWLIAADGLHSPLRRVLGLERASKGKKRFGLRQHFETQPWTDLVEVHWSTNAEAYVTPLGPKLVGVAVLSAHKASFDEHLAAFPELRARLRGSAISTVRGAGPFPQYTRRRRCGRVLFVGDASGYLDPLTGEGIALSVKTARALVAAIAIERPELYESQWQSLTRKHRVLTGALLHIARRRRVARQVVPAARALPWAFNAIVNALA
ncbi:MAG: NAD(P)/FAD-dependent oxidoreductase [Corynebacteriales bacterium]|nr:NAD(P)/FAD-dependent oxidoreductase [Mycobacteriales bacterium]